MGVNSLPKTVTRQRRDGDLNPGPSAPESNTLTTQLPNHPIVSYRIMFLILVPFVDLLTYLFASSVPLAGNLWAGKFAIHRRKQVAVQPCRVRLSASTSVYIYFLKILRAALCDYSYYYYYYYY